MKVVLEKKAASTILNLEDEFLKLWYNMSFNLRGRSSRKQKFRPLDKVGREGNASVKVSSAQQSYLPVIDVQATAAI